MKGIKVEIYKKHISTSVKEANQIVYRNLRFTVDFNDKFNLDKAFFENNRFVILFDGFLLDKMEWFDHYKVYNMTSFLEKIYIDYEISGGGY